MHRFVAILALALSLSILSPAKADVILNIGNLTLPQGGTGLVNVLLHSTSADLLDIIGVEFRITPLSVGRLEFVSPPLDPQLSNSAYLFFGNSAAALSPPAGSSGTTINPEDSYYGADGTLNGVGVLVTGTDRLLVQLAVTAATGNPPPAGATFTISLIDDLATLFVDPALNEMAFASNTGTVTITAADVQSAPEPSSLILVGLGGLGLIVHGWRRKARQR